MTSFATQVTENKGDFPKMTSLLSGGVGTVVCFADLGLRPSGKRSTPTMEETVLLRLNPGTEVIGNHSSRTMMASKPEDLHRRSKEFPRTPLWG